MHNTIAQIRSAFALEQVQNLVGDRKEFGNLVKGLPAMILQNGFGQSLAFLLAKGTDKKGAFDPNSKYFQAFQIIVKWLSKHQVLSGGRPEGAIKEISTISQSQYLMAQTEALEILEWVKRYANAGLFSK
jgi:CRISPR-associated protein Cmr5